jgi:hypothetical protein
MPPIFSSKLTPLAAHSMERNQIRRRWPKH